MAEGDGGSVGVVKGGVVQGWDLAAGWGGEGCGEERVGGGFSAGAGGGGIGGIAPDASFLREAVVFG